MGLIIVERILLYGVLIGIGLILFGGLTDTLRIINFGVILIALTVLIIITDNVELRIK